MYNRSANNFIHTAKKQAKDDSPITKFQAAAHSTSAESPDVSLLQLIQQHQHQQGWILLIAPSQLPTKGWAEQYQLSLQNVLVIHQKQIANLSATLQQALTSPSCKVVINFTKVSDRQLDAYRHLAVANNIWFYQREQISQQQLAH